MDITLGKTYRDKITGFEGVATGRCQYLSGCNQALLTPTASEPTKYPDGTWLDEQRLEEMPGEAIVLDNSKTPGCDIAPPVR